MANVSDEPGFMYRHQRVVLVSNSNLGTQTWVEVDSDEKGRKMVEAIAFDTIASQKAHPENFKLPVHIALATISQAIRVPGVAERLEMEKAILGQP